MRAIQVREFVEEMERIVADVEARKLAQDVVFFSGQYLSHDIVVAHLVPVAILLYKRDVKGVKQYRSLFPDDQK